MSFFEKSLTTLELPAVLTMLAAEAVGDTAKERALALTPSTDEAEVRHRIEETTAAKTMMVVRGSPSFYGVKDVRASLARADLGGALNTRSGPSSLMMRSCLISRECCNAPALCADTLRTTASARRR